MAAKRDDLDAPQARGNDELLAAYVDGVGELTVEERRRVERALATPEARAEQDATRDLLARLRELPPAGNEPDWSALERSIADAVGDEVPRRSWFYRWRFALPAIALAAAAIALVVIDSRATDDEASPIAFVPKTDDAQPVFTAQDDERVTVYLDGTDLEIALETADAADDELDDLFLGSSDPGELDGAASLGFLEPTDLAWIDDLDDEALTRAEQLLDGSLKGRKGS